MAQRQNNVEQAAGLAPQERQRMTPGEKLISPMDLISQDETDDEMVDRILEAVEQVAFKKWLKDRVLPLRLMMQKASQKLRGHYGYTE